VSSLALAVADDWLRGVDGVIRAVIRPWPLLQVLVLQNVALCGVHLAVTVATRELPCVGLHSVAHVGRGRLIGVVAVARRHAHLLHAHLRRVVPGTGIVRMRIPGIRDQNSPAEVYGGVGSAQAHVEHSTRPRLALVEYFGDHLPQHVGYTILHSLAVLAQLVDRIDNHTHRLLNNVQRVFRHHVSEHLRGPHQVSCKRTMCDNIIFLDLPFFCSLYPVLFCI